MGNSWVMRNKWIFVAGPLGMAAFVWACGEVVMHLWNWLLPMLFDWPRITFWEGLGLLLLCRILFGSWGGGSDRSNARRHRAERWERMTPEEREKFRENMRTRCGGIGTPTGEASESV